MLHPYAAFTVSLLKAFEGIVRNIVGNHAGLYIML